MITPLTKFVKGVTIVMDGNKNVKMPYIVYHNT